MCRRSSVQELTTLARVVGLAASPALVFNDPETAGRVLQTLRAQPRVIAGTMLDAHGQVFARYRLETEPGPAAERRGRAVRDQRRSHCGRPSGRCYEARV